MGKNYSYAFCDGGVSKYAVVFRSGIGIRSIVRIVSGGTNDDTESSAVLMACEEAEKHGGNWRIVTDSQAVLDKVNGNCANATKQPNINGIRRVLDRVNSSPRAGSIQLEWKRRLSEPEMVEADSLCKEKGQ